MVRPYLEEGAIRYRYPKLLGSARPFLSNVSRLSYALFVESERLEYTLMRKGLLSCVECRIAAGSEPELWNASVHTSGAIFDRFIRRLGGRRWVAFDFDVAEPSRTAFATLLGERGVPFLDAPGRALESAERDSPGRRLRMSDGAHLNAGGNRVLGEALAEALTRIGELPVRTHRGGAPVAVAGTP